MESVRETEKFATFPGSVGHICQEKTFNVANYTCSGLLFCYLLTIVAHLLLDDIKHTVAHFASILCFQDFFHIKKVWRSMKKKQKPSWKFLPRGADYTLYRFLFGKIQVSLTIKKPHMYAFLQSS